VGVVCLNCEIGQQGADLIGFKTDQWLSITGRLESPEEGQRYTRHDIFLYLSEDEAYDLLTMIYYTHNVHLNWKNSQFFSKYSFITEVAEA
jgi:hypothetical protein